MNFLIRLPIKIDLGCLWVIGIDMSTIAIWITIRLFANWIIDWNLFKHPRAIA